MVGSSAVKLGKLVRLLIQPRFTRPLLRFHVAAAIEHLEAIRYCAAATLIDVGANKGQFSLAFRGLQPIGRIVAFEPLPPAAEIYQRLFSGDDGVILHRVAISEHEGTARFHVADREDSSSLLKPGSGQAEAYGVSGSSTIEVDVKPLEGLVDLASLPRPVMLKIDVQGGELSVLKGCARLEHIDFIYVELSYVELYDGQPLFDEVATYLFQRGFKVGGAFNQSVTSRFGPTQIDVLFVQDRYLNRPADEN